MKLIYVVFFLSIISIQIQAQVTQEWVARHNGSGNLSDNAKSIAVDLDGNVFVTGTVYSGTSTSYDFATVKYNSLGEEQWVRVFNGPASNMDESVSLALDSDGNVYVTGYVFAGAGSNDFATIKYNSDGDVQWVQQYNSGGNSDDRPVAIKVDDAGNVYITGTAKADFFLDYDWVTIKYSSSGIEKWVKLYNSNGLNNSLDIAVDLAVDNVGNVYVTGRSVSEIANWEYATIKYDSVGNEQWIRRYHDINHSASSPEAIAVDNLGNVYVTGSLVFLADNSLGNTFQDYATVKYNSVGVEQWVQKYNGITGDFSFDEAIDLALDHNGNIYVTGSTQGVTSISDFATIKYNPDGGQEWVQIFNGSGNGEDRSSAIVVDNEGSVYVAGKSFGNGTGLDYSVIKYNTNGEEQWIQTYNGPGNNDDYGTAVEIDNLGNVYVTGFSVGIPITSGYDYATIKYSQPQLHQIQEPKPFSKLISGEKDTIKWTDPGWGAVNIICKTNVGTPSESEVVITQGIPNVNSKFLWDVPDTLLSFRSKIIVENANNTTEKIESDIFRIKPYVLTRINSDSTYYEYRKNRDQWGFSNTKADMWSVTWYNQFNYSGTDPFTNKQYSPIQGDSVFAKIAPTPNAHMDWVSWVKTFGVDACYFSAMNGWYKPTAIIKWRSEVGNWNGSCFGIAAANALAFGYKEQFQNKYPNFPAFINPITVVSDTGVKRVANELYTHQYGNPTQANDKLNHNIVTPNMLLEQLKQMLLEDNARIRTLSIYNNGGSGGHTILAYGLKKDPTIDGLYYVSVYDNSNPASNNPIQISTLGGNGFWGTPDWAGWGGNTGIYLEIPAEQYFNPTTFPRGGSESPFIVPANELQVNSKFGSQIKILDNQGNMTGYENGFALSEIPGSLPLISRNGSETPPYGYSLPADNYSVLLNQFEEDTVSTFFFTGNKSFVYERSGAAQTQTDRLFFDGGVSATNPDAQTKTIKLLNLLNENTQEKLAVVRSIELAQNDSVKIVNPDSNKVKIISYGTAKTYDLELNYATENQLGRFVDSDVSLSANTSHTFVPVWTDLTNSELQVLVDIGNDGTIDDTLTLVNQVTGIGDDQGSLITPNSYNLAQNYPNPFNPTTKISWQSPVSSHQTLKVYDVLGNEVATLVDEYKPAGSYEVTFDASRLASGIYLYKLQAGSFLQTRKMILIK